MNQMSINYDRNHDVLYAKLPSSEACYGEENDNGIVTYFGMDTDKVLGVAIFGVKSKLQNKSNSLMDLPLKIDFKDPKIQTILNSNDIFKCELFPN